MPITLREIAKMIDHSLLHPTMTDEILKRECLLAAKYNCATVCIKPYAVPNAKEWLHNTDVLICAVAGFPHGNSHTEIVIAEALRAIKEGAKEIDIVSNTGKVLGEDWNYVKNEIKEINSAVVSEGAILKVIFENDFLQEKHIIKLCEICSEANVAFVKTSTGYGFVKQPNGFYSYAGATIEHLKLMRKYCAPHIQIKAAGGIKTLKDLLLVRSIGVTRVGATATATILDEAEKRLSNGENLNNMIPTNLSTGTY
ncbi:MAG TPA: deoxyribose-phosphate aldolase [Victivallales bacterium]|nr:deoxyribose-phosphate aldolase [Bacteroidales bacterium]HPO90070.1 deoxyribose-phosphate aldolase [Victivallales bacterium]HRR06676.1 deoxyribose-phosphate aldolase [Victivallales bacterium]HRR29599.1 deoxyribose-phosphate aldolase [Victivallales bacterium]HRU02086.1 deoxyribose-phosphate aldolase [Victivallales bacterium]